jgi:hypothetical protein
VKKIIIITVLAVTATDTAIAGAIRGIVTSDSNIRSGVSYPWITHYDMVE